MKPVNAVKARINCDLSEVSLEDALVELNCFPLYILRVSPVNVHTAMQLFKDVSHLEKPRVSIVIDHTYDIYEWSVEYNGKVWWSPGV